MGCNKSATNLLIFLIGFRSQQLIFIKIGPELSTSYIYCKENDYIIQKRTEFDLKSIMEINVLYGIYVRFFVNMILEWVILNFTKVDKNRNYITAFKKKFTLFLNHNGPIKLYNSP